MSSGSIGSIDSPPSDIRVGCAGWAIPAQHAAAFPGAGTHLQRYARRFSAVEINSSFYRPHRPSTYVRWAESVPEDFRFAVKVPREITHHRRLADPEAPLDRLLAEIGGLGSRLGPLLVQLPPSLRFDAALAGGFFAALRRRFAGAVVCEPRHPSWFAAEAGRLLGEAAVARVAADPAVVPAAAEPGGWNGLVYCRLHGSPERYYSAYPADHLDTLARVLTAAAAGEGTGEGIRRPAAVWCVFDNTARGAATVDALGLMERLGRRLAPEPRPG